MQTSDWTTIYVSLKRMEWQYQPNFKIPFKMEMQKYGLHDK